MPKIVNPTDVSAEENEAKKDYFDRHTPHVICESTVKNDQKCKVKVHMGKDYPHPDDHDHYIQYLQLWNGEFLLAEARFTAGSLGNNPGHAEVDFYVVPSAKMNLTAMSFCTKHGLWQSEPVEVEVS